MSYDPKTGIYKASLPAVPNIPSNLSVEQFIFEHAPSPHGEDVPWLIDAITSRTLTRRQARERTAQLAKGLRHEFGLSKDETVVVFSGNEVDYPISLWAIFRCGAIASCANPSYVADELRYQITLVDGHHPVKVLLTHPDSIVTAVKAAELAKLPPSAIVLIAPPSDVSTDEVKTLCKKFKNLDDLIKLHAGKPEVPRIQFAEGEAKKRLAFLSFSSGTTGLPKAVAIPHISGPANILQSRAHWDATLPFTAYNPKTGKGDKVLGVLPFYHIYGLIVVLHMSLYMGVPVVTLNKFTLPAYLTAIQKHRITSIYIVPPMVIMMIKNPMVDEYDLSSLRMGMAGAAPLSSETTDALKKKFPKLTFGQGYGMTETCTIITLYDAIDPDKVPAASVGRLVPNIDAKVVSPDGKFLPPGEIGELLSRSPSNALGYLGNKKATDETFDSEGFVHTGDEVYIKDGWVYVTDRIKELIKVKGMQVAPAELEGLILDHPDVQDVCVIGIPDERAGERPKAYVHLSSGAQARVDKDKSEGDKIIESIKKFVADRKIDYKRLGEVEFIDAVPKTASGKLLRKDLRVKHAQKSKGASKL
ncbi:phenylacetyl-CoA ligase [Meredithblackwellia eburnea MCA 4105]